MAAASAACFSAAREADSRLTISLTGLNDVVTISGSNDAPKALSDADVTDEDTVLTLQILGNDSDPDIHDVLSIAALSIAGTQGHVTVNADGWPINEYSLGTADMDTTRRYSMLAEDGKGVFREIEEEYKRTVQAVLQVTGQHQLLEKSPILARSIKLRNPYVDALHIAQIALLRRYRALPDGAPNEARDALLDAVHHSINGIAAGLQTTG